MASLGGSRWPPNHLVDWVEDVQGWGRRESGGWEGGIQKGTHPPQVIRELMLSLALPIQWARYLGRGVPDPVALPPPTHLHVTGPHESRGQRAGPEGVLTQFP